MKAARFAVAALAMVCTAAAGWGSYFLWQSTARSRQAEAVVDLVQRCSQQMFKDSCRVMNTPAPAQATVRLFIAGVGEVDAAAFAALRRYGEAMCREVGTQCAADWEGRSCRIARALYPVLDD